jgi:hypothetical protein
MSIQTNKLRKSTSDELLNHGLLTFVERDVFLKVSEDDIVEASMATRKPGAELEATFPGCMFKLVAFICKKIISLMHYILPNLMHYPH